MIKTFNKVWFIFLLLAACSQDGEKKYYLDNGLLVKVKYYPDGKTIQIERTYKNDSIPHGYMKEYYPTGNQKTSREFKDGLENGKVVFYSEDGVVQAEGYSFGGERDSTWIWYDSIGLVKSTRYFYRGESAGKALDYRYHNGKRYLASCRCYTYKNNYTYSLDYDISGKGTWNGAEYVPGGAFNPYDPKVAELFEARIYPCACYNAPEIKVTIESEFSGDIEDSFTVPVGREYFYYSHRFTKPGSYIFRMETSENTSEQAITVR